jgi:ribonuclease P protein component
VRRGPLGLSYLPSTDPGPPQVAFALTRRVGTAVVRNRLRRRLRAALVESAGGSPLESGAYVVTAGPEASSLTYQELQHNVALLLTALAERLHGASAR